MPVKIKINRLPRLDLPRFTRVEMKDIGESVKDAEVERIKSARKPDGSPANPLKVNYKNNRPSGYAIYKQRRVGRNKRDWFLTGQMLASLKTTVSNPTLALIKFTSDQAKKAAIREAKDEMFNLSNPGKKAGADTAKQYWDKAVRRANRSAR